MQQYVREIGSREVTTIEFDDILNVRFGRWYRCLMLQQRDLFNKLLICLQRLDQRIHRQVPAQSVALAEEASEALRDVSAAFGNLDGGTWRATLRIYNTHTSTFQANRAELEGMRHQIQAATRSCCELSTRIKQSWDRTGALAALWDKLWNAPDYYESREFLDLSSHPQQHDYLPRRYRNDRGLRHVRVDPAKRGLSSNIDRSECPALAPSREGYFSRIQAFPVGVVFHIDLAGQTLRDAIKPQGEAECRRGDTVI